MASLAEGLALAAQAGLSQAELLEIISLGAMANPMFKLKVRWQAPCSCGLTCAGAQYFWDIGST